MIKRQLYRSDMFKCQLCYDAPCSKACKYMLDPAGKLRSVWFHDEVHAALALPDDLPCIDCAAECEDACIQKGEVDIKDIMIKLNQVVKPDLETPAPEDESRLRTHLCGIPLENPFLLSSSVVGSTYDMCARAFEAGWAGVAFKTICTLDIHEASPRYSAITGDYGSIIGFKNIEQLSDHSVQENMEVFRHLKQNYPEKVIIASIMGQNEEEWGELAYLCQENGADAIELNFSCPNMAEGGLGSDIGQVPELVERFTRAAKSRVSIPVLAKLTPNVDVMSPAAEAARRGGADGIAAINTIKSIVGVDPLTYVSAPNVSGRSAIGGYSGSGVRPIALRFISELGQDPNLKDISITGMGGIETWRDALEFILLGCSTVQITTAVMQYGYRIIDDLKAGLNYYLKDKGIDNVEQLVGAGLTAISPTTETLDRDTILYPRFIHDKCNGCGRCYISCRDGGHQAITLNEEHKPILNGTKCVGCHLCLLICPLGAIVPADRRVKKRE